MSSLDEDEMQTALSYYVLYAQLAKDAGGGPPPSAPASTPSTSASTTTGTACPIEVGTGNDEHEHWIEDVDWTDERMSESSNILEKNEALCDVESSSARGSYLVQQYEVNAGKHWDDFYSRHHNKFFKDRHYLHKTFPDEFGPLYSERGDTKSGKCPGGDTDRGTDETFTVMEIGCGVGNTLLPLLERGASAIINCKRRNICVWGLDFASVAIDLLKKDQRYIEAASDGRAMAGVWDITQPPPSIYEIESISDVSILLFCLSAVSPDKMSDAARHAASTIKPGGTLVFRDYGRYDEAQMKLGTSRCKRLGDNFYVKSDGTRCYYFDLDDLRRLFGEEGAGLEIIELTYLRRVYENRSQDSTRTRVWVQGRFRKPGLR